MKYPQKVMRMKELIEMGLPEQFLMRAFRDQTQDFAWKINPAAVNSPILFDTEGLEAYRMNCIKTQKEINKKIVGVM